VCRPARDSHPEAAIEKKETTIMKGHKGHHHRKADGGGVKESKELKGTHEFAPEAPENQEAKDRKESFKKGGHVRGHKGKERLDKRARGGRIGAHNGGGSVEGHSTPDHTYRLPRKSGGRVMSGGGSVLSGAAKISEAKKGSRGGNDPEDD
jgi:hypothetical protein